jgi:hypothetical protein
MSCFLLWPPCASVVQTRLFEREMYLTPARREHVGWAGPPNALFRVWGPLLNPRVEWSPRLEFRVYAGGNGPEFRAAISVSRGAAVIPRTGM